MNEPRGGDQAWRSFIQHPIRTIDPDRLSLCFGGNIDPELALQIKASPRLRERLGRIVRDHYRLLPPPGTPPENEHDMDIALAPSDILTQIVPRAGAIYWSAAIANTVYAADVAALQAEIGEDLCNYALKHRDLAGPETGFASPGTAAERVAESGWQCLAAWCEALDPAVGARLRLKLPPTDAFDAPAPAALAQIGPKIVRRAATEV